MQPWWEDFFRGPYFKVQGPGYPAARTAAEVDVLVAALELRPGQRVLDVPCGEGRHTIELGARGIACAGVDFNPAAVAAARTRAAERQVDVELHVADMRTIAFADEFDAAFCFFSSFGYFSDDDNLRCARALCSALRPDGKLLIDTQVMETVLPRFSERSWSWADAPGTSTRILEERRWNAAAGRILSNWTFIDPSGAIETAELSIRLYTCRELSELLRQAGFRELRAVETLTGAPFALGARRLSLIASR